MWYTFQVAIGCLREIGSNGEIGIRSIDAKIAQTTIAVCRLVGRVQAASCKQFHC